MIAVLEEEALGLFPLLVHLPSNLSLLQHCCEQGYLPSSILYSFSAKQHNLSLSWRLTHVALSLNLCPMQGINVSKCNGMAFCLDRV